MRKSVGISILVVGALLLAFVAAGRVWVHASQRWMAVRRDTLAVRLDSCLDAATLLCGMDSLYRVKMHRDTAERFRMVRKDRQPDSLEEAVVPQASRPDSAEAASRPGRLEEMMASQAARPDSAEVAARPDSAEVAAQGSLEATVASQASADSLGMAVRELLEIVKAFGGWMQETNALSVLAKERARFTPSICPLKEGTFRFTAPFGVRTDPMEGDGRMHDGIDLACPQGNPVHVTADGVVEFIDSDIFGYGNCIIVDHGYGYKTRYAHLSIIRTSENIRLKRGDIIGETGVSGRATGPHLHYEVILDGKTVDPEEYIDIKLQ